MYSGILGRINHYFHKIETGGENPENIKLEDLIWMELIVQL